MPNYNTYLAYKAYVNKNEVSSELYKNIVLGSYFYAVEVSKNLSSSGYGEIITTVVMKLAREHNDNLVSFVHRLWHDEKDIVIAYIPAAFRVIFDGPVTLTHQKYGLPLKMVANVDQDGNRAVWGDSSDNMDRHLSWKLLPISWNNRVFFRIKNMEHDMVLKLDVHPNNIGDRVAFGSQPTDASREDWILQPVVIDDKVLFRIVNKQFDQGLKLQKSTNDEGDRKLWGHNGRFSDDPTNFAWAIHSFRGHVSMEVSIPNNRPF